MLALLSVLCDVEDGSVWEDIVYGVWTRFNCRYGDGAKQQILWDTYISPLIKETIQSVIYMATIRNSFIDSLDFSASHPDFGLQTPYSHICVMPLSFDYLNGFLLNGDGTFLNIKIKLPNHSDVPVLVDFLESVVYCILDDVYRRQSINKCKFSVSFSMLFLEREYLFKICGDRDIFTWEVVYACFRHVLVKLFFHKGCMEGLTVQGPGFSVNYLGRRNIVKQDCVEIVFGPNFCICQDFVYPGKIRFSPISLRQRESFMSNNTIFW